MAASDDAGFPARHWHAREGGGVQCDLCPRACVLQEGQHGACFVRACRNGRLELITYGRSSGFHVDPVEKKPLYHFLPGSPILSFGTAGCNLACRFCQNWDLSRSREHDRRQERASPEQIAEMAVRLGCRSVAFTYNEPLIFLEYAVDVAAACREVGLRTVAVTNGYVNAGPRAEFFAHMDAANVDLKAFTERFYRELCGGRLAPVLETLAYLRAETPVWLEVTTLVIPGHNDSATEIEELCGWVVEHLGVEVPLHFSAFHPDWKLTDCPSTPPGTLTRARATALAVGVRYAYTGNVRDPEGATTSCHACGEVLLERSGFAVTPRALTATGVCGACGTPCAGVFASVPRS